MKIKRIFFIVAIYSLVMLLILLCGMGYLLRMLKASTATAHAEQIEYVYVRDESESVDVFHESESRAEGWIVKEHAGQIGIFRRDGTLLQVLDTYVKTLPKADRDLLGEGILVQTQKELNAIIEDYSD